LAARIEPQIELRAPIDLLKMACYQGRVTAPIGTAILITDRYVQEAFDDWLMSTGSPTPRRNGILDFVNGIIVRGEQAYAMGLMTTPPTAAASNHGADNRHMSQRRPTETVTEASPMNGSNVLEMQYKDSGAANDDCPVCFEKFEQTTVVMRWPCSGPHAACRPCGRAAMANWRAACPVC